MEHNITSLNQQIGQYELIIKDIIQPQIKEEQSQPINRPLNKMEELEKNIELLRSKLTNSSYNTKLWNNYISWIEQNRKIFTDALDENSIYNFFYFHTNNYSLTKMQDYYDVPETDKLFSFTLFVTNYENLSYFIGLVYNYFIIRKYFKEYKMRVYIDFHSVFGSCESFNIFNMFMDIIYKLDPDNAKSLQLVVFFLNPFHTVNNSSIYSLMVEDISKVHEYYINLFYKL